MTRASGRMFCTVPLPKVDGIAHDERAPIVLQGAGQNLRGRRGEPAGQHDERPVVEHVGSVSAPTSMLPA